MVSDEGVSALMVVNIYDLTLAEELFKHGANLLLINFLEKTGSQMDREKSEELQHKSKKATIDALKSAAEFDRRY